jgi:transposase
LLAVELFSGECFFQAQQEAKSEQVAAYLLDMATHLQQQGYRKAHVFIDNNPTHQQKMLTLFQQQSAPLTIQLLFHYLPKYSPKLNLVEYLIHLIRQKWLHHGDYQRNLAAIQTQLTEQLHQKVFLTQDKIINILQHIQNLVLET